MQAMRRGQWKAVRPKPNAPVELYDLTADRAAPASRTGPPLVGRAQLAPAYRRVPAMSLANRYSPLPAVTYKVLLSGPANVQFVTVSSGTAMNRRSWPAGLNTCTPGLVSSVSLVPRFWCSPATA